MYCEVLGNVLSGIQVEAQRVMIAEEIGKAFAQAGWPLTWGNPQDLMDLQRQAVIDNILPENGFGPDFERGFFSVENSLGR